MSQHGTLARYCEGCRCPECAHESFLHHKRYKRDVQRNGPRLVDAGPLIAAIDYAENAGIRTVDVLKAANVNESYIWGLRTAGRRSHRLKRDRILAALEQAIEARRDALDNVAASVEYARGYQPPPDNSRRWPADPIIQGMVDMYGSIRATPHARDIHRIKAVGTVSAVSAERWAKRLGVTPEELWPDWWHLKETG